MKVDLSKRFEAEESVRREMDRADYLNDGMISKQDLKEFLDR